MTKTKQFKNLYNLYFQEKVLQKKVHLETSPKIRLYLCSVPCQSHFDFFLSEPAQAPLRSSMTTKVDRIHGESPYLRLPPTIIKKVVRQLRSGIQITTHKHLFKSYENSFYGNEAVTWMTKSGLVPTRQDGFLPPPKTIKKKAYF